ncbi:hypothetical protein GGH14_003763 [Coemansia sp. RSA 370]|nr:hypothetical protein GGH14_003763 [Coemansia sp. RSA 370]
MLSCFKLKGAAVRIAQSTRPALLYSFTCRRYASAIDSIAPERQQEIAAALRTYQKDNIAVPWFDMVRRYKIPQVAMEQALVADNARLQKRAELSMRVTQMADQAYDEQRGRCDWDSVARDMDMPLIECLRLFDASLSTVPVQTLPNITDWSVDDLSALKSLVLEQFGAVTADEWRLVGIYMNVEQTDCYMAYDEEISRLQEIIKAYYRPGNRSQLSFQAQMAFPKRTEASILGKIRQYTSKNSNITQKDMDHVNTLVEAYGKDWERIGQETDVSPRRAQRIWAQHQQRQKVTQAWTKEELETLRNCIRDGIGMAEASRIIGTKMSYACNAKMQSLKRAGLNNAFQKSRTLWNDDDVARLVHLVSTSKGGDIDWTAIGKELGRTAKSCHLRYTKLHQKHYNAKADHSQTVSCEVQKQYEQHQRVDWTNVAQQLGLSERECLEANQFNDGKARWVYDPDTFSWDTADRMAQFIKDNYPKPVPVNYTAVSNYMWTDKSDCVKMTSLLRGEVTWTAEALALVVRLRDSGMKFEDIAHQLSPTVSASRVTATYHKQKNPHVYQPLLDTDRQQIKDIMDTRAHYMDFADLRALVIQSMPNANKSALYTFVDSHGAALPAYKERLKNSNVEHIASQIMSGTKQSVLAKQMGIPSLMLTNLMRSRTFSMHSRTWTQEETDKLIEVVRASPGPFNWKSISEEVGTKDPKQCRTRYFNVGHKY